MVGGGGWPGAILGLGLKGFGLRVWGQGSTIMLCFLLQICACAFVQLPTFSREFKDFEKST